MIVYGYRSAHLKTAEVKNATCPSCDTKGSMIASVYSKHAHIFWIPLFPFGKTGAAQCTHCKHTMKKKEMTEEVQRAYNELKDETKPPIWQFSGLGLIAVLVALFMVASANNEKENKAFVETPLAGDIYEYKTETGNYSTMKVIEVVDDSLVISPNDYEIDKATAIHEIDKDSNYTSMYIYAHSEITQMLESGEITDVNRD